MCRKWISKEDDLVTAKIIYEKLYLYKNISYIYFLIREDLTFTALGFTGLRMNREISSLLTGLKRKLSDYVSNLRII